MLRGFLGKQARLVQGRVFAHTSKSLSIQTLLRAAQCHTVAKPQESPIESAPASFEEYLKTCSFSDRLLAKALGLPIPPNTVLLPMFRLYRSCSEGICLEDFRRVCAMPDNYQTWVSVTHFHVWMAMARVCQEGKIGRDHAAKSIFEDFWKETRARMRQFSKEEPGVKRSESERSFFSQHIALLIAYEKGIYCDDTELARLLWSNLFVNKGKTNVSNLALLVNYTRKSVLMLDQVPSVSLLTEGKFKFPPLIPEKLRPTFYGQ